MPRATYFFLLLFVLQPAFAEQGKLKIADQAFTVDLVRTQQERERGLSGRTQLADGTGLLMIFDQPGNYGIWMKEMNFSIDIVWINQFGSIVHIERQVPPASYPKIFTNTIPASYVLEVAAGESDRLSLNTPVYFIGIAR